METFEQLLTTEFFLVVAGIFAVIYTLRRSFSKFFEKGWVGNLLPLLPLVLGVLVMVSVPDLSEWEAPGARALHGIFAGFFASHLRKLGKQTILKPILEKMDERKATEEKEDVE